MSKKARGREKNPKQEQRGQFKQHANWHHVYPTSRFKIKKDPVLHTAWHDVFQNKTPEEAIETVREWMADPKKFEERIMGEPRRLNAWKKLFGEFANPSIKIIKAIEEDWTYHGVRMIKVKGT